MFVTGRKSARGQCLQYSRSFVAPRENCALGPREQANLGTSFLDASNLYGSSLVEAKRLREFKDGKLKAGGSTLSYYLE